MIWLKGFTEGVHEYNITPKQWELLKEKLGQVIGDDNKFVESPGMFQVHPQPPYPGINIGPNGTGTPNIHDLVDRYPWGAPTIWGGAGTAGPPIDCLTTSGYAARTDAPVNTDVTLTVTTGSGIGYSTIRTVNSPHVTYSTGTAYNPQSGSWHYTTTNDKTLLND